MSYPTHQSLILCHDCHDEGYGEEDPYCKDCPRCDHCGEMLSYHPGAVGHIGYVKALLEAPDQWACSVNCLVAILRAEPLEFAPVLAEVLCLYPAAYDTLYRRETVHAIGEALSEALNGEVVA